MDFLGFAIEDLDHIVGLHWKITCMGTGHWGSYKKIICIIPIHRTMVMFSFSDLIFTIQQL